MNRKTSSGTFDGEKRNKNSNAPNPQRRNATTNPATHENSDHIVSPP